MAITRFDLVRRALQMKQDGLEPQEIGRKLVDIARASGHVGVVQVSGPPPEVIAIKLLDTNETIYFDGTRWDSRQ